MFHFNCTIFLPSLILSGDFMIYNMTNTPHATFNDVILPNIKHILF